MQFSQFFSIPLYLGPSFAGSAEGARFSTNFRDQWPQIDNGFLSYSFSYDQYLVQTKASIGFLYYGDHEGTGGLSTHYFSPSFSYTLKLSEHLYFAPGINLAYELKYIDFSRLTFGDQLSYYENKQYSIEAFNKEKLGNLDFGTSAMFFYKQFWSGVTFNHLNMPNQTFRAGNGNVPVKYSFYGGAKIQATRRGRIQKGEYIYPNFLYQRQRNFNQLTIGLSMEKAPVFAGVYYRGLPVIKTYNSFRNNDAVVVIIGLLYNEFRFSYSYDFTVSGIIADTNGAHEIVASYVIKAKSEPRQKRVIVPCPRF